MMIRTVVGAVALVAGGFAGGFAACALAADAQQQQPAAPMKVTVYEDGSGQLPAGTSNSVLGDLSGRGFCITGELCND